MGIIIVIIFHYYHFISSIIVSVIVIIMMMMIIVLTLIIIMVVSLLIKKTIITVIYIAVAGRCRGRRRRCFRRGAAVVVLLVVVFQRFGLSGQAAIVEGLLEPLDALLCSVAQAGVSRSSQIQSMHEVSTSVQWLITCLDVRMGSGAAETEVCAFVPSRRCSSTRRPWRICSHRCRNECRRGSDVSMGFLPADLL